MIARLTLRPARGERPAPTCGLLLARVGRAVLWLVVLVVLLRGFAGIVTAHPQATSALAAFAAPEVLDGLVPELDLDAAGQQVLSVNPAGATRLNRSHALVTVAARLGGEHPRG